MPAPNANKYFIRGQMLMECPLGNGVGDSYGGATTAREYHNQYDDFSLLPPVGATADQKDRHFSITGTGTVPTPVAAARGGFTLATRTTSAADNDEARLFPFTASNWGIAINPAANKEQMIEMRVNLTQIAETQLYFGWKLTDTGVVATDANQALILFDTDPTSNFGPAGVGTLAASANFYCVTAIAGDDVAIDSKVPVVLGTEYLLQVTIASDRKARFFINRRMVAVSAGVLPTTAALIVTAGIASRTNAGAAKSCIFRQARRFCSL